MNKRWIAGGALFLAAFGYSLYGAYPSVSVGDSGEFVTAGATLGIPHAPGFPTYTILAKLWSLMVPWGNVGYRVNLFSVFCGALTILIIFGLVTFLTNSLSWGLLGGWMLMASHAF